MCIGVYIESEQGVYCETQQELADALHVPLDSLKVEAPRGASCLCPVNLRLVASENGYRLKIADDRIDAVFERA